MQRLQVYHMSLVVTKRILSYSKAAAKTLESATNDIVRGYEEIDLLKATVLDVRKNIDQYPTNMQETNNRGQRIS